MSAKKRKTKKTEQKTNGVMSLFDHLNNITEKRGIMWESMSESDRKTFSPYMVNRFLSMNFEWLPIINQLQRLTIGLLSPKDVFRIYYEIIPSGRIFLKYVKSRSPIDVPDEMATIIMTVYQCSKREMVEYYYMLKSSSDGKKELVQLMENYGLQEDEIKKLRKDMKI